MGIPEMCLISQLSNKKQPEIFFFLCGRGFSRKLYLNFVACSQTPNNRTVVFAKQLDTN